MKRGWGTTPFFVVRPATAISHTYTYDPLKRLTEATGVGTNGYARSYSYDTIGNITYKSDVGTYTYSSKPHAVAQAGQYSFSYDANGNMTQRTGGTSLTITWNVDNKPSQVNSTTLSYDGNGQRVRKIGNSTVLYYGELYEERDGSGIYHIFAGSTRVASIGISGSAKFYHANHLGSASVITNESGVRTGKIEYYPYGTYRSGDTNPNPPTVNYTFTDQEYDDEYGLYNYDARLYDPVVGRFISADSIIPDSGDLQAFNRYSYCVNNPLIYVDPSGNLFGLDDWVACMIIGAIIGALMSGVQSNWNVQSMAVGAVIGGVAGAVGGYMGGFILGQGGNEVVAVVAAGAIGGAVGGSMNAAYYGGNMGEAAVTGAAYGAAMAGLMYGAQQLYGYLNGSSTNTLSVVSEENLQQSSQALRVDIAEDALIQRPDVIAKYDQAWADSLAGTPNWSEQGYALLEARNGDYWVRLDSTSRTKLALPDFLEGADNIKAIIHTHPVARMDVYTNMNYSPHLPSPGDVAFAVRNKVPVYYRWAGGIRRVNPDGSFCTVVRY